MNELPSSSTGPHAVEVSPFVSHDYDAPMEEKDQPQKEDNSEAEAFHLSQNSIINAEMDLASIHLSQNTVIDAEMGDKEDELENQAELTTETEREQNTESKRERQAERERQVQARIRQREREMRQQRLQNANAIRPPRPRMAMEDPYDSSESGYWSIRDRRPKTRTEKMWAKVAAVQKRMEAEKAKQKKKEDEQELDAMFHVMLHGCGDGDDLCFSDGEYEYKLPAFLRFDEVKRGFQEQMKKEKADREARLAREEKEREMAENQPNQETKPIPCHGCCSHSNGYKFPPIKTEWTTTPKSTKDERKRNNVIIVNSSSDEEEEIETSSQRAAVKWASCSSTATSANSTVTSANSFYSSESVLTRWLPRPVITVHNSDSDSD